jgi:hypothetical protein
MLSLWLPEDISQNDSEYWDLVGEHANRQL